MKILRADFIITCKDNFEIIKNGAICFEQEIKEIDTLDTIKTKYPQSEIFDLGENSVIMPGLINPHIHLEFSSNITSLKYGSFIRWLGSVIQKRDEILQNSTTSLIEEKLQNILKKGTTTVGAISSFGGDLEACSNSPIRVVFFNEVLGSRMDMVDIQFNDFKSRLRLSCEKESKTLIPAISVHSPYSTHPIVAKNALDIAKKEKFVVSTHFMESQAERDWLDSANGEFVEFFNSFIPNAKPLCSGIEYIKQFEDVDAIFTHCTKATKEELALIENQNSFITHCPVSNRLLGNGRLNLGLIDKKTLTIGTDGLSSNISIDIWEELKTALMMHYESDLNSLAKTLIISSTKNSANALNLNTGVLEVGKKADIISFTLPDKIEENEIATQTILQKKEFKKIYVEGEEIL